MTFFLIIIVFGFGPLILFFIISTIYGMNSKAKGNDRLIQYVKKMIVPLILCDILFAFLAHGWDGFPDGRPSPLTFQIWVGTFIKAFPFFIMFGFLAFYIGILLKTSMHSLKKLQK